MNAFFSKRKVLIAALVLLLTLVVAGSVTASALAKPGKPKPAKVSICHRTNDPARPYRLITVSEKALKGHSKHYGEIIPAPATGCPTVLVTPTPSPTVTPTGEPTP
jgi:hypothetical protein